MNLSVFQRELQISRVGEGVLKRNNSSAVERGIAGPKVTGSIPVCSFFVYYYTPANSVCRQYSSYCLHSSEEGEVCSQWGVLHDRDMVWLLQLFRQFSDRIYMSSVDSQAPPPIVKQNSQIKALFLKNGQLQAKQPCTNICQIITPVICLIFTYLIKELASQSLPSRSLFNDSPYPYVFNDYTLIDQYSKIKPKNGSPEYSARSNPLNWYLYECVQPGCNKAILGSYTGDVPSTNVNSTLLQSIPNSLPTSSAINYYPDYYSDPNNPVPLKYFPFFDETNDINTDLFQRLKKIQSNSFTIIKAGRLGLDSLPDGAFRMEELNATKMKVRLQENDVRDLDLHRNNGVSSLIESLELETGGTSARREIVSAYGLLNLQHLITSAYSKYLTGKPINAGYVFMRDTESSKSFVDSIINTVSALVFPLSLSLLFPVMLYGLVLEKQQKLVQMMKMNGMRISSYWLVYFIFNFILCLVTNIVFFLLGSFALKTTFFLKTSPLLLVIIAVGWSLAQIGLAAFFQTFLNKARSANIIGYIIAIWTMMIGSSLNIGVYQVPTEFPGWLQALPPFAFNRLFYLMLINCSDADCYNTLQEINPEMKNCIVSLYAGFVVFFLLGAYLFEILPQQFGVRRHPLFPLIAFYKFITCKNELTYTRPERDRELRKYLTDEEEDPSSKEEREVISRMMEIDPSYPLVINNLRKLYQKQGYRGDFAAVKSFNLKVKDKETFGLLGPNGAGKTTLISMLTGMIKPNYGNAWIGGYDIITTVSKAQLQMGVCPQFDLLWPQLTVEQHLIFYARLKGIPGRELKNKVDMAIEEVNLTKFRNFLSSSLSGGMKRRLSIAISLVGDPKIVFLDEPSSGLDPDNRRQIWEVLAKCQDKRSVFLTTHMMEQAEALCHRIGIITRGTLRTVGNQLRLKKQYGNGYRLSLSLISKQKRLISPQALNLLDQNVNMEPDQEDEANMRRSISDLMHSQEAGEQARLKRGIKKVTEFIINRFPGSSLNRQLGYSLIYKVPNIYKISQMFIEMHGVEKQLEITNVSITDSSLEDVFITVVLKYDKITDEEQEANDLMSIPPENQVDQSEEIDVPRTPPTPPKKKTPEEEKFGSIIEKSRESVMSEEQARRRNDD